MLDTPAVIMSKPVRPCRILEVVFDVVMKMMKMLRQREYKVPVSKGKMKKELDEISNKCIVVRHNSSSTGSL